jgi:hypothetical protein
MGNELSEEAPLKNLNPSTTLYRPFARKSMSSRAVDPPPELVVVYEMAELRAAARERAAREVEPQLLYNAVRAHELAAGFNEELSFDRMQLHHLEKTQHGIQDKRARLESHGSGEFETIEAIRARYRMPRELIRRIGNFTAEHIVLINENPWQRLEALEANLSAADAEIERLENAIAAAKTEYFELVAKGT